MCTTEAAVADVQEGSSWTTAKLPGSLPAAPKLKPLWGRFVGRGSPRA